MEVVQDPIAVINTLQATIDALKNQLRSERSAHEATAAQGITDALRRLRLHGVIPLYVGGRNSESLRQEIASTSPELNTAVDQVWLLERAPVSHDVKRAIHAAANNGMSRW